MTRKIKKHKTKLFLWVILLSFFLVGCQASDGIKSDETEAIHSDDLFTDESLNTALERENEIVIGLPTTEGKFHPLYAADFTEKMIVNLVFEGLLYEEKGEFKGLLSEEKEWIKESNEYIFSLRKDVFFHDQVAFTSKDVVYTYQRMMDESVYLNHFSFFENLKSVKAISKYEVAFQFENALTADVYGGFTVPILPEHIYGSFDDEWLSDQFESPVGTGIFKGLQFESVNRLQLAANESHHRLNPVVKTLVIKPIFYEQRLEGIKSGQMDLVYLDVLDEKTVSPKNEWYDFVRVDSKQLMTVGINHHHPFFSDVESKQALRYGMALDLYEKQHFPLGFQRSVGLLYQGHSQFQSNSELNLYQDDFNKATRLLEVGGWMIEEGAFVRTKDEEELLLHMLAYAEAPWSYHLAEHLKKEWLKLGVNLEVEYTDFNTLIQRLDEGEIPDLWLLAWEIPDPFYPDELLLGMYNYGEYESEEVEILLSALSETQSVSEKLKLWSEIELYVNANQPLWPIGFHPEYWGYNKRLNIPHMNAGIPYWKWFEGMTIE